MTAPTMAEQRAAVIAELAEQHRLTASPPTAPLRIIRIAADLRVGDWLRLGDREVLVTHLNPPTRNKALAEGRREVWSMTTCLALDADDPVTASPRELGQAVAR